MTDHRTFAIIGAAMEVHRELGCGFLEAVYQEALERELTARKIPFNAQPVIHIAYKGKSLDKTYQPDFICFDSVLVELKAMTSLSGTEVSQLINYLKATGLRIGLLINFGSRSLEYKRYIFSHEKQGTWVCESQAAYDPQITQITQMDADSGMENDMWAESNLLNLDELAVTQVVCGAQRLQFKKPLKLEIDFDEKEEEFKLELPDLNIFIGAKTREELSHAFCEDMIWLWEEYGKCAESELSEDALRLRNTLRTLLKEESVS